MPPMLSMEVGKVMFESEGAKVHMNFLQFLGTAPANYRWRTCYSLLTPKIEVVRKTYDIR